MRKRYNEIMQEIEVTDEMRGRVLDHILTKSTERPNKTIHFLKYKKTASWIACAVLLIVCGVFVTDMVHSDRESQEGSVANPVADMIECKSVKELSQRAGFTVKDVGEIPFEVLMTSYTWCWNEFAEVRYVGNDNTLSYRKSAGNDDISGDYTDYEQNIIEKVNGSDVTIKGNKDLFFLVTWQSDGYSFSISVSHGIKYDSMLKIMESVVNAS